MDTSTDTAKELAVQHWAYIEDLLLTHSEDPDVVELIGSHYKNAMIHGFRHGVEFAENL